MNTQDEKFQQALQETVMEIQGYSTDELRERLDESEKSQFARCVNNLINPCSQNNNEVE